MRNWIEAYILLRKSNCCLIPHLFKGDLLERFYKHFRKIKIFSTDRAIEMFKVRNSVTPKFLNDLFYSETKSH